MSVQVKYLGEYKRPYLYFQSYEKGERFEKYLGRTGNPLAWEKAVQYFVSYLERRLELFELDLKNKIKEHSSSDFGWVFDRLGDEKVSLRAAGRINGVGISAGRAIWFFEMTGLVRGGRCTQLGKEILLGPHVIDSLILKELKESDPIYLEELHTYISQLLEQKAPIGTSVRIPVEIFRAWRKRANKSGVSLSRFIIERVEDYIKREGEDQMAYINRSELIALLHESRDNTAKLYEELRLCRARLSVLQAENP